MLCTESKNGWTVFASHPEDCSKFFICHGLRAFPIDCAAGTLFDKNLKICNHAYLVDCKKEPLKTTPETIKITKETSMTTIESTTTTEDPTTTTTELATEPLKTSEKTDPCLKKSIGINPRDVILDLDSNCEENLTISKSENQPNPPLPPCKLDIRLGDPEYDDIIFDTEKCDPLPIDSAKIHMNKWQYELINSGNVSFPAHAY